MTFAWLTEITEETKWETKGGTKEKKLTGRLSLRFVGPSQAPVCKFVSEPWARMLLGRGLWPRPDDPATWLLMRWGTRGWGKRADAARLWALCDVGPEPASFLDFAARHLPAGPELVDEWELWGLLGLEASRGPEVSIDDANSGVRIPEPRPITFGDVLFALAFPVTWLAYWRELRSPTASVPRRRPALRVWEQSRWQWVEACAHVAVPGLTPPWAGLAWEGSGAGLIFQSFTHQWPLCGREECPFGRGERFWAGLGQRPRRVEVAQGLYRWVYPGLVAGVESAATLEELRAAFVACLNHIPVDPWGSSPGLKLVPAGSRVAVRVPAGGFGAWVYQQLLDQVRQDLGEPGEPARCLVCRKDLPSDSRRDRKTCSDTCRKRLWRLRRR